MTQQPSIDDWDPLPLDAVADIFAGAPFRWWVCGGLALELHAGSSWRSHDDLDVGILRSEAAEVYSWLTDWDLWVAARGELSPWRGQPLEPDRGQNNVWVRDSPRSSWRFDLTIGSGDDAGWAYRRDESVRRDWDRAVLWTTGGMPYLAPELQLLFKSKDPRPKDVADARQVIPLLDTSQRAFLADHLHSDQWRQLMECSVPPVEGV